MYFWTIWGSEAFNRLGLGTASLVEWPRNVSCTRSIQSILWSDGQPLWKGRYPENIEVSPGVVHIASIGCCCVFLSQVAGGLEC